MRFLAILSVLSLVFCGAGMGCEPMKPVEEGAKDASPFDGASGEQPVAKACGADTYKPQSCGEHPKPGSGEKYGSKPGDILAAFSSKLSDCQRQKRSLRELTCGAELILFNVGAGWCAPCIEETRTIEQKVHGPFCKRGLRIVQVLFEQEDRSLPTSKFCSDWTTKFKLHFPILIDPLKQTQSLFDHQTGTPLNLLVDGKTMKILFRWEGEVPKGLEEAIDKELQKRGL